MTPSEDRWSVHLEETTLLGRYVVDRMIGGGGMANVYLARDEQLEMPVVVKVPHVAYLAEPGFRERFDRETRDLITLQHPHIVRILARGEHEGLPFLILQFLQGGSLGDRFRKAKGVPLAYGDVSPWIRDIARALDFIHQQGVVHRDIKPDNVLFDEYGHAYLSDFGIAKAVGGADTGLTVTGATPGSPAYMAPEQPRQSKLTGASDQYSLAATLYEALCGEPTHEGETIVDVLIRKQTEKPRPLRERAPEVPQEVSDALMRALARDPDDRWSTCEAMVDAMETPARVAAEAPTLARGAAVAAVESAPPSPTSSFATTHTMSRSSHKSLWLALATLCIAVPLAYVFMQPGGEDAGGDRATTTAALDGAGPDDDTPEVAAPRVAAPPPPPVAATREVVGHYVLDVRALEKRLALLRRAHPPKRPPGRKPGLLRELTRMIESGFELDVRADHHYTLNMRAREDHLAALPGTWALERGIVVFRPTVRPDGKAPRTFRARPAPGGLLLLRGGQDVLLKRR